MRSLLLLFFVAQLTHGSCPPGFELIRDGECRGLYTSADLHTDQAITTVIAKCADIQGEPVIIHTEEQQSYWMSRAKEAPYDNIVIGLVCNQETRKWQWADGSTVDFKPPAGKYSTELDKDCEPGCSWVLFPDSNGASQYIYNWFRNCEPESVRTSIFCTKQLVQPTPSGDGCEAFADDSDDGVCYQVGAVAESWQDAQVLCKKLGAELASVHNQQENTFLRRLAVSRGAVNGLFLGATVSGKGKDFGWVDDSAWDYQNFYSGFPLPGYGDCLAMDTSSSSGQWMNFECSAKLPVACVRKQNPDADFTEPTCNSGPYEEGALIVSPGFPFRADVPCNFFLTVDVGKRVEAKILQLEANSCCDFVTLYDSFLGGNLIANVTGVGQNSVFTSTTNSMKVSWQPKGGVNVMGLAMTFRGV